MSRPGNQAIRALLMLALVLQQPLSPATITVGGGCTLADAIAAANFDAPSGGCPAGDGADVLELTGDVVLTEELPVVTDEIFLEGNDFTIGRDPSAPDFRILDLDVEGDVALRNITVTNGSTLANGGGIRNNARRLTLIGSRVLGNEALGYGGGIASTYTGARALFIRDSTVADNTAQGGGGGLRAKELTVISGSTFSGNQDGGFFGGGGISGSGYTRVAVFNSTLSGNSSSSQAGGLDMNGSYGSPLTIVSSTIVGNSSLGRAGGLHVYDGWLQAPGRFHDTVIAGNSNGNCEGFVRHLAGSFDDDGSCDAALPAVPEVDFDLELTHNGGPTLTHALLPGSVMVDGGGCGLARDQRGFDRVGPCDSGAFELGAAPVGGSLRDVRGISVTCSNLSSGSSVSFGLDPSVNAWDCEAKGLAVDVGDTIRQFVIGGGIDGAGGSVIGLAATSVSCLNQTTGQSVDIDLSTGPGWDCAAAGLVVSPDDRIRMTSIGDVP